MPDIVPDSVYADGGVIGPNPSKSGGTWAFVWTAADVEVKRASGIVLPSDVGLPTVTNNLTEFVALLHAIETLPAGWSGKLYTDSLVTLRRFKSPNTAKMAGIPDALVRRMQEATRRIDGFIHLLAGHPTIADLANGFKKGVPVSAWNSLCDHLCSELAAEFKNGKPRKVDQTVFGPDGNCLQAAVATVLGVGLNDVPHFCGQHAGNTWFAPMQQWAVAHHKLAPVLLGYNDAAAEYLTLGGVCVVGGKTARSQENGTLHAVVYRDGKLFHDPHPERAGLTEITDVLLFVPIDPARRR